MDETIWEAATDPLSLLRALRPLADRHRKFRLFCCGYCRAFFWAHLPAELQDAVAVAEEYADGAVPMYRLRKTQAAFSAARSTPDTVWRARMAAQFATAPTRPYDSALLLLERRYTRPGRTPDGEVARLVRNLFADPFRAPSFDPGWRTSTAVALARQMYESRDFSPMPILADALQDAGCEDETILAHCRGDGPHVRGCWAVDLLLSKE